jgi:hypothetical protein
MDRLRFPLCVRVARILAAVSAGLAVPSGASVLTWGPAGSDATAGVLDATLIPKNGQVTYSNVEGGSYDLVVTTSGLNADGEASFFGAGGWWFEGSPPSASSNPTYATVTFRFYHPGTTNPIGLLGISFFLEDAEKTERFRNFAYFDAAGTLMPTTIGGGILSFSVPPIIHLTDGSFENGSTFEGGDQVGKSIGMDVSSIAVSGFTFQAHRQTSGAGSVIMTPFDPLIADFATWATDHFGADAADPLKAGIVADPDADGLSNLMEYFYGTDPKAVNATAPQQSSVVDGKLTLAFTRNPGASDLTVTVCGADSVAGPWADLARSINGGPFTALVPGVIVAESGTASIDVLVSDLYAAGDPAHPSRFLCLKVVR